MNIFFPILFLMACAICVDALTFTLYKDSGHTGTTVDFNAGDHNCHNDIAARFNDVASSINTHGGCVALFKDMDCKGTRKIFKPNCDGVECCTHRRFKDCDFNDVASSFAIC